MTDDPTFFSSHALLLVRVRDDISASSHLITSAIPAYLCRGRIAVSKMLRADIKSYCLVIPKFTILIKTLVSAVQSELSLSHGHAEKQRGEA